MRKVMFMNWEKIDEKREYVERSGLFHQWGMEQCGDSLSAYTVALIETPDGNMHTISPHHVKFVDEPTQVTL